MRMGEDCIEAVRRNMMKRIRCVDNILGVVISDKDGIPLVKVCSEKCPETALRPSYLGTFPMASDHLSRIGLGRNNSITAMYENYQVTTGWEDSLVISVIGTHDVKTGLIMSVMEDMKPIAAELSKIVESSG